MAHHIEQCLTHVTKYYHPHSWQAPQTMASAKPVFNLPHIHFFPHIQHAVLAFCPHALLTLLEQGSEASIYYFLVSFPVALITIVPGYATNTELHSPSCPESNCSIYVTICVTSFIFSEMFHFYRSFPLRPVTFMLSNAILSLQPLPLPPRSLSVSSSIFSLYLPSL